MKTAFQPVKMSDAEFQRFSSFIYDQCGIKLPPAKKTMLTGRLQKRLRSLEMNSFQQYFDYMAGPGKRNGELVQMLNSVSTNKTEFFREAKHFDFLSNRVLPELAGSGPGSRPRRLNVWSAGCSSGEEPYTLAMVLADFCEGSGGDFSVLATDISTRVLECGQKAVYSEAQVASVPAHFKRRYLMRGKGSRTGFCRVVPELRSRIRFHRLNLNGNGGFGIKTRMDVVFCRNVIIYFDRETQIRLFDRLYGQMASGGYLFIGHSETLHGVNDRFEQMAVSVYQKP